MSSDLDAIKAIVDAFERSDWAEIDVRSGSLRIRLSSQPQTVAGREPVVPVVPAIPARTAADTDDPESTEGLVIPDGAHLVTSPSPGIFWRSPNPGAPPFADVGDDVAAGSTLCIVEVMKLMNHISSDIGGTVVGVYADNGMRVDRGDVLFAVQSSASP